MQIRVRIAPSPTGPLHIGTARAALFNYLFAKKNKGSFILRIDDTDTDRSSKAFEEDIKRGLLWLSLKWDEFYKQSERIDIYREQLLKLLEEGKVFWCWHSQEELASERDHFIRQKSAPRHICEFRDLDKKEARTGEKPILRFKNNEKEEVVFNDLIRGKIEFRPDLFGDFSVAKNLEAPLYNFSTVLDDSLMKISHVIRGEDHISNTPKQILIYRALGFDLPEYAHLPLILGKDRSKLSKRHQATSLMQYEDEGYLPEALINFLALLGWREANDDGEELFSIDELCKKFSLDRVQKSAAVFDVEKLNWINSRYLRFLETKDLAVMLKKYLKPAWKIKTDENPERWIKVAALEQPRIVKLEDITGLVDYFFEEPFLDKEMLLWKKQNAGDAIKHLEKIYELASDLQDTDFSKDILEKTIMPYAGEAGRGEVLWPFRVALSGKTTSPGPFEIAEILGREETLKRTYKAKETLES
ncbi:MAG: glutamate--tRNA ligase [Candidatus Niyogibacteria bacterium CG10_big_fil_rev_8_21_14_0_10_42_19]|uniref:Glutamate--tRNA ligase n=1 Tax=Candidatus Niyogibacteria bacterium CG10_big_fil_rev_8_21_14_0_10_42_19 TaxID=1974725 RepID=A0A2H0TFS6_9BACT|nr:MAG: glutamate--tRNA ligase [Candidatus Niyogibacteria bacterium CG10_big_fil_rev_8_21_14_0_10_42_19]